MILFCWQIAQPLTYCAIHWFMPGQVWCCLALWMVLSLPGCPAVGWLCTSSMRSRFCRWAVIGCEFATLMNLEGEIKVMLWLSSLPWPAFVGHDRASARILVFPGTCLFDLIVIFLKVGVPPGR